MTDVVMKIWHDGCEIPAIRLEVLDVYTDVDGNMIARLDGEFDSILVSFDQKALDKLKQGMRDNQRLRPDRGYANT